MHRSQLVVSKSAGMTLVELMVAVGVTTIIMALSTLIFLGQYKSYRSGQAVKTTTVDIQKAMELVRDDLTLAGWAVKPQMAFYFVDGGDSSPDQIYLSDISLINPQNTTQMLKLVDSGPTRCGGCRRYLSDQPDPTDHGGSLDINGDGDTKDLKSVSVLVWGDDSNVTRVRTTDNSGRLGSVSGMPTETYVTPAIYYSVVDNATTHTLKREDRNSGGAQPIAENVVDLQMVYGNSTSVGCNATICPPPTNIWRPTKGYGSQGCVSGTTCQKSRFDASQVSWVNLYMVARSAERVKDPNDPSSCRPAVANHLAGNSTTCGYEYRVYVSRITPLANKH